MEWTEANLRAHGLRPPTMRVPIPEGPQDLTSLFSQHVAERPDAEALVGRYDRLTYRQLDDAVNAGAVYLASLGVNQGDRVACCTANHTDIVVAFLAVQRLGGLWIGINRNTTAPEKQFLLNASGVVVFLGDNDACGHVNAESAELPDLKAVIDMEPGNQKSTWLQNLKAHAQEKPQPVTIDPFAPAAIAFTSGTTGFPKGVVHSQHNMLVAARVSLIRSGEYGADVNYATALPLTILNLMILGPVAALSVGAKHVCIDQLHAQNVADWVASEKINNLALVPTVVQDLLTNPDIDNNALRSLKKLVAGGATIPQNLPRLYQERFGEKLKIGYGLTECPTGVSGTTETSPSVQGAIGQPIFHLEVSIQDETGHILPNGTKGEICFRAVQEGDWANVYTPTLGYWNNLEATDELLRGGWVHTGDIGSIDQQGELFIHDRSKDVIIRGGSNVYPAEVERVLRMDSRVKDCAVVGKPDERLGEVVVAFVEPFKPESPDLLTDDLMALCVREISKYKIPAEWHVVEALPRNAMGKVVKPDLRDRLK